MLQAAETSRADAIHLLQQVGHDADLLDKPRAHIRKAEFSAVYRALAITLDDEMLRLFLRAFRHGALKFTCLALLDAKNLMAALHRRLADEGTSVQRVKDEFRRDRAVQMLTKGHEPINAISAQLGFDSTASFHRAFRGWTGDTPGAFRGAGATPR